MEIINGKPAELLDTYTAPIKGNYAALVRESMKNSLVKPLLSPVVANAPAEIKDDNGNTISEDDVIDYIMTACDDVVQPDAEKEVTNLFENALLHYDKAATNSMYINDIFAVQSASKAKLPMPSPTVVYLAGTDVQPHAKGFLAGTSSYDEFFASLAFTVKMPKVLGFYFSNNIAFENFKSWFKNEINMISPVLPSETTALCADFDTLTLDTLTESLILRNNDGENCDDYSFARVLITYLMQYKSGVSPTEFGVLPFNLSELFNPKSVVFVNVQKHSVASASVIMNEWNLINKALKVAPQVISNTKLNKLTGTVRMLQRVSANAAVAATQGPASRAARTKFKKTEPTQNDLLKNVTHVLSKMAKVQKSENAVKNQRKSFSRANRREPNNFNRTGKMTSINYKPDIHIYQDTSGSISERNYQATIKALIALAKKMNVNIYFNSFSHCMSQCTKLHIKDKSVSQIWAEFEKIPKVDGGTNFSQIWEYIQESPKRQKEFSLLITDFEWYPPNQHCEHPKNLYYAPVEGMSWQSITRSAEHFVKSMEKIDGNIRRKVLF